SPRASSRNSWATHCGRWEISSPPSWNTATRSSSPRRIVGPTGPRGSSARSRPSSAVGRRTRRHSAISSRRRLAWSRTRTRRSAALMDRAAAMMDIGQFEAAGPVIEEAKRLVSVLEEKDSLFVIDISDGQREMGLGRWTRATRLWDRGLRGLKDLGGISDYARALTYVGRFYLEKGETEPGLRFLEEARGIAKTVGLESLLSEIQALDTRRGAKDLNPPPAR